MRRLLAVAIVVAVLLGAVPVAPVAGTGGQPDGFDRTGQSLAQSDETTLLSDRRSVRQVGTMAPSQGRPVAASQNATTPMGSPTARASQTTPRSLVQTSNFDSVEFHITVYDNSTAKWTFVYQRTLNNQTEVDQFEQFADEFNNNSTELYRNFKRQATDLTAAGENETGRPMQAEAFSKHAEVGGIATNNLGIVKMSFHWTWFATDKNERVAIGDVFEGGLYVGPNQSLVLHHGPGLRFASVEPDWSEMTGDSLAGSESVTWLGEMEFTDQHPQATFEPVDTGTSTTTDGVGDGSTTDGTPAGEQGPGDGSGGSPLMLFVTAVVVLLGLAAAFAWRQGDFGSMLGSSNDPGSGPSGGAAGGAAASTDSGSNEPSVSDEELLTDEARVKKLLDENGGRMKQVNIVEETGWSKSKVSMLLSEMEDDGEISKLRVGRENIISLEGHEPDAAGSPLEE